MSRFIVTIHCPPWSHQSVTTACDFVTEVVDSGHEVDAIFLYQDGVLNAAKQLDIPSDELNGQQLLLGIAERNKVPLLLCVTAAEKRGLIANNIHEEFAIAGLAEFAELSLQCDRVVQFK